MFKRILVVLLVLGTMMPLGASAQSSIQDLLAQIERLKQQIVMLQNRQSGQSQCFSFNRNLGVGASGRDVRELHVALAREGFPVARVSQIFPNTVETRRALEDDSRNSNDDDDDDEEEDNEDERSEDKIKFEDNKGTDRYTEMTAAAVSLFQTKYQADILTASGLSAPTGYFGAASRRKMNSLSWCDGVKPIDPTPMPPQGKNVTVTYPNGGESWLVGSAQSVRWLWSGDTSTNLNVFLLPDDRISERDWTLVSGVDSRNGTAGWSVIIPSVPTGQYKVAVCDTYMPNSSGFCDTSDSFFKIYANDTGGNLPPSISGVSGPTTLKVGKTGKWVVKANDPEDGPLTYSVYWGDEIQKVMSSTPSSQAQQTATFTHSFASPGTYTSIFTVTDNAGQSARTSLSVVVRDDGRTAGVDLAVTSFELNGDGPLASFCNSGSVVVNSFPLNIAVDGVNRTFDMAGYKIPGQQCGTPHQWYYATWGLNSAGHHSAEAQVDPLGVYVETNESNNWLTATYNGQTTGPVLKIISPNGGETFSVDSKVPVTWTGGQPEWEINIFLVDTRTNMYISNSPILDRGTRNDGYEVVAIPDNMPTASAYKFRVTCNKCANNSSWWGWTDDSDGTFTINNPSVASSVQVLNPNGGETWFKGEKQTISWGATGAPEVSVYLIKDSDPTYRLAIKHNHMSGRANVIYWTVPGGQTATRDIAIGSDYRIQVIGGGATAVDDRSDRPFTITATTTSATP